MKALAAWSALVLLFWGVLSGAEPSAPAWKAGVASTRITPQKPMWMAGYASRTKPSEGVVQDLYAKALAVEDAQGGRFVAVTMDLIGIPAGLRKQVEEQAQKELGLPPERLFLNCSHTHCGPEFRVGRSLYLEVMDHGDPLAAEYGDWLALELSRTVKRALEALTPASLSFTEARCGFAMNRRLPTRLGFRNSPYPEGPVDHAVPVLEVKNTTDKLLAVMFGYACHNTTLGFQHICGDYAGYAQQYLEEAHPETVALFVTGCAGDQNPYPRGTLELAQQHGRTLANAVEAALTVTEKRALTGPVKAALERVELPFATPPTRQELETGLTSPNKWEAAHARMLLHRLDAEGALPAAYPYPVQVVSFGGDLLLVGLGGEVVVDYSLRLKAELAQPKRGVWVAGYSNDVMGYIPSARILHEGGYEGGGAMLYTANPGPWTEAVEERIVGKVLELKKRLSE